MKLFLSAFQRPWILDLILAVSTNWPCFFLSFLAHSLIAFCFPPAFILSLVLHFCSNLGWNWPALSHLTNAKTTLYFAPTANPERKLNGHPCLQTWHGGHSTDRSSSVCFPTPVSVQNVGSGYVLEVSWSILKFPKTNSELSSWNKNKENVTKQLGFLWWHPKVECEHLSI